LKSTKAELLGVISQFDEKNINTIPFEGSWTSGQVAEHVLKSAAAMAGALNGPAEPAGRNPEQHIQLLSQVFLNFDHKLNSPDFIIPSNEPKEKQKLVNALEETFDSIVLTAASGNLDLICIGFEMPTLGTLSRKEIIWFTIVHTQRHIHQLKNIAKHFEN
jgi:hypothetical protein